MTESEAGNVGYIHGKQAGDYIDLPELYTKIPLHLDWVGYKVVSRGNVQDVFEMLAREILPVEPEELQSFKTDDDRYQAYEEGVRQGIRDSWESRKHYYGSE